MSRGSDLRYNLNLTLEQAVGGDTIEIKIPVMTACADCDGQGVLPALLQPHVQTAMGRTNQGFPGFFLSSTNVPKVQGLERIITDPCRSCGGSGRVESKTLSVKVPAGVDNGDRIRLTGEGEAGLRGGPPMTCTFKLRQDHPILSETVGIYIVRYQYRFQMPR